MSNITIAPEKVFNKHSLNLLRCHPHQGVKVEDSTQVFNLVDNVLSKQKITGELDSHTNDYKAIVDYSLAKIDSIFDTSKTFETYFHHLKEQLQEYVHTIVSKYIEPNTEDMTKIDFCSNPGAKSIDQVLIIIRIFTDAIRATSEGFENFIIVSGIPFFVNNRKLYTYNPQLICRTELFPKDYILSQLGSSIIVVSKTLLTLFIIDVYDINSTECLSLQEVINTNDEIVCIGENSGCLSIITRFGNKISEILFQINTKTLKSKTLLYESQMNTSKFYFRNEILYECGEKTCINGKIVDEKPLFPIYADKTSSYYIENGELFYQKYPSDSIMSKASDMLNKLTSSFSSMKDKFIAPLLAGKKINFSQFVQNITTTARLILFIMERIEYIPKNLQLRVIDGLLTILTINLKFFAFQNIEASTTKQIDRIFRIMAPFSSSLSVQIMQCMLVIPTTIYSNSFILKEILQKCFIQICSNKENSSLKDLIMKRPQSLLMMSQEYLDSLPSEEANTCISNTIDFFPICYEAMNATEACIEYVSIVLKTIRSLLEQEKLFNPVRYLKHLMYNISAIGNSQPLAVVFLQNALPILSKLTKSYGNSESFIKCNKNYIGLDKIYTKLNEYVNTYILDYDTKISIDTHEIKPVTLSFKCDSDVSSEIKIDKTFYQVRNGLVIKIPQSNFDIYYYHNETNNANVEILVKANQMEPQPEDELDEYLTLINYFAKFCGSFATQLLEGQISHLEYSHRNLVGNIFIRSFQELSMSENPETLNYPELFGKLDELFGVSKIIKKSSTKYNNIIYFVASAIIFQLNLKDVIEELSKQEKLEKKSIPQEVKLVWSSVASLRRFLINLNQKELAETNNEYSFSQFTDNILEKSKYLLSTRLEFKGYTTETIVKHFTDLIMTYIPVSDVKQIVAEQNKRLIYRKLALDFIKDFMKADLVESTIETLLINVKTSFDMISDGRSSKIGSMSNYNKLIESANETISAFLDAVKLRNNKCIFISFMKFFCRIPQVIRKFTEGLTYIITKGNKECIKYAEDILASISSEPDVTETLHSYAIDSKDEDYQATVFFILALSDNTKLPYDILFAPKKSQKCEVASLVLAEKMLVGDKDAEGILFANLDRLCNELAETMTGKNNRFSVAAEIISFFRYLMLPFSVHKEKIIEYIHSLFKKDQIVFTNPFIAALLILGHGFFCPEDTGVVYYKYMTRILYKDINLGDYSKVTAMVRIPASPQTFNLTKTEVDLIVGFQEKINSVCNKNKPIELRRATAFAIFSSFLTIIVQNPHNAELLKPHFAKLTQRIATMTYPSRKAMKPLKIMSMYAENMYHLSNFPERHQTASEERFNGFTDRVPPKCLPRFINLTNGIVQQNHLDSAAFGLSVFVGDHKIRAGEYYAFKIFSFSNKGCASIGFIDANSTTDDIIFYGLTQEFSAMSCVHASVSPNNITVNDSDIGMMHSGFVGDVYPAVITSNCRLKMTYVFDSMENYTFNNEEKYKLFDHINRYKTTGSGFTYNSCVSHYKTLLRGEKVITKNHTIGEIDATLSRISERVNLKIQSRDGSSEIITVPAKDCDVIPEPFDRYIDRAKRMANKDNEQNSVFRGAFLRKQMKLAGKIILICQRALVPYLCDDVPYTLLRTLMNYSCEYNFAAKMKKKDTKKYNYRKNYITDIDYLLPNNTQNIADFVIKKLAQMQLDDFVNTVLANPIGSRFYCPPDSNFNAIRAISTFEVEIKKDSSIAAIYPIDFRSKPDVYGIIPPGTYTIRNAKSISYYKVPKNLPDDSLSTPVYYLHAISQYMMVHSDTITIEQTVQIFNKIYDSDSANPILNAASQLLMNQMADLCSSNRSQIPSTINYITKIYPSNLYVTIQCSKIKQRIIDSIPLDDPDFESIAISICGGTSPMDKEILDYYMAKAFDKSDDMSRFNIFAIYSILQPGESLRTIYSIGLQGSMNWSNDADLAIKSGNPLPTHSDTLIDIRKRMLDKFFNIETEKYSEVFSFDYLDKSCALALEALPSKRQIFVAFNRFAAMKFLEGRGGESLIHQFVSQYTSDYSCLRVLGCQPWSVSLHGENAVDLGGPSRELFTNVCEEIIHPRIGLLAPTPNNDGMIPTLAKPHLARAAGAIIAACATSKMPFPFNLSVVVWKYLSGSPISDRDIFNIYEQFNDLVRKLNNNPYDTDLELQKRIHQNFTVIDLYGNELEVVPNGKQILLTGETIQEFIRSAQNALLKQLIKAMEPFRFGFYEVIPQKTCALFTSKSLAQVCCSDDSHLQIQKYLSGEVYPVLRDAIDTLTAEEKTLFIKFCTGQRSIPNHRTIDVRISTATFPLPYAATCFLRLYVPKYKNVTMAVKYIKVAINFGSTITDSEIEDRMFR